MSQIQIRYAYKFIFSPVLEAYIALIFHVTEVEIRNTRVGILILATPARLDTRTAGVTRQCSRKDGSFPHLLHT